MARMNWSRARMDQISRSADSNRASSRLLPRRDRSARVVRKLGRSATRSNSARHGIPSIASAVNCCATSTTSVRPSRCAARRDSASGSVASQVPRRTATSIGTVPSINGSVSSRRMGARWSLRGQVRRARWTHRRAAGDGTAGDCRTQAARGGACGCPWPRDPSRGNGDHVGVARIPGAVRLAVDEFDSTGRRIHITSSTPRPRSSHLHHGWTTAVRSVIVRATAGDGERLARCEGQVRKDRDARRARPDLWESRARRSRRARPRGATGNDPSRVTSRGRRSTRQ